MVLEPSSERLAGRATKGHPIQTAPPIAPAAEAAGERRYLTVMFCDLLGSTGISAQLDAEDGAS